MYQNNMHKYIECCTLKLYSMQYYRDIMAKRCVAKLIHEDAYMYIPVKLCLCLYLNYNMVIVQKKNIRWKILLYVASGSEIK